MKNIEYLCQTIGLQPSSFYISTTDETGRKAGLAMRSDICARRPISAGILKSEKSILFEAQCLYEQLIADLLAEYALIERFYEAFYNDENTSGSNTNSSPVNRG